MKKKDKYIGILIEDKYKIVEKIGDGGMAYVYKAIQINLDRPVAIKVLKDHFSDNEEFVKRFIREAKEMAGISHPNVVGVYDYGKIFNSHYIVMELLQGSPLDLIIRENSGLSVSKTIGYIYPIANALDIIHKKGLVHRDIKSANIFITNENRPVLMDFGITWNSDKTVAINNIMGTAEYMSPEQANGDKLDGRSDIYSLGVVLYECITGSVPFRADSVTAVLKKVMVDKPGKISSTQKHVPKWLQNLVDSMLEKEPDKRPQNILLVSESLQSQKSNKTDTNTGQRILIISIISIIVILLAFVFVYLKKPKEKNIITETLQESTEPVAFYGDFVTIQGGEFIMGNDSGSFDQKPAHKVKLDSFQITKFEITNKQFVAFLNFVKCDLSGSTNSIKIINLINNPFLFYKDSVQIKPSFDQYPVVGATWKGAQLFCKTYGGNLPTEAQWEYVAKTVKDTSQYNIKDIISNCTQVNNNKTKLCEVGSAAPNSFGIYDMIGNVWEWCSDYYSPEFYKNSPKENPKGSSRGSSMVIRGGDVNSPMQCLNSTFRMDASPEGDRNYYIGFRMVLNNN